MRLAVVDIGTNTVRLLVTDAESQDSVAREQRITRLGEGVDASGVLHPDAIARTLEAVDLFVARARELDAEVIRVAGTSALRDAANTAEFANDVRSRSDVELEVLKGIDEGRFAYQGATSWLDRGDYLVCDIGGGSTELISADGGVSMDVGSVRIWERYLRANPPNSGDVARAAAAVADIVGSTLPQVGRDGEEVLVGVAATITTLAALAAGLDAYDTERVHGAHLAVEQVIEWRDRLNSMPVSEIVALGPVEAGRADVLGPGALILAEVMTALACEGLIVSERDILDGLAADLAEGRKR